MKITILETGRPPEALRGTHGDYPAMFERLLGAADPALRFETVSVVDGAPPPDPAHIEAAIITGSSAGAYEAHDWIPPLEDFIRAAAAHRLPLVGICFGHQIIAQALGGRVEKSDKGWGVGRHAYELVDAAPWGERPPLSFAVAASHQDQVVEKPDAARVLARSQHTEFAALAYDRFSAVSFQGHPEMSAEFAAALVSHRRGRIEDGLVDAAVESLAAPLDQDRVAGWIVRFLRAERAKAAPAA